MSATAEDRLLGQRPPQVLAKLPAHSRVCLLNGRDILTILKSEPVIVMACNTRIKHVIPGIMRAAQELDAVVAFELARSECSLEGGYTGFTPQLYVDTLLAAAEETNFTKPFFIHADHITVKSTAPEAIASARQLIEAQLAAGYTSFAIDASFNELPDNIQITTELAQPIVQQNLGLEVEVGEIKSAGQEAEITTVAEAVDFIKGLKDNGVYPDLLAINNGSKHGNYLEGEKISIDLDRTGEIYGAIKDFGVCIAQHGVTGTPLHLVGRFADYGIRKANVGTQWQNIAHAGLPEDLMADMRAWASENKKDIKFTSKPFKAKIDAIPAAYREKIAAQAYNEAKAFIQAFRAVGTASKVVHGLVAKL
ncbi:MAG: fructose-bisphosphate aldolase [Deltaproteobacteria bacterium]|nr:fructose-bisphosphate aldolase [Deltaproteobacteria bacterium]